MTNHDFITEQFNITLKMLFAQTESLRDLATMSGYDPLTFYRFADLSHLDLSGQDLRGLNFEGADFRGSNLEGVKLDLGSLNNSTLDSGSCVLKDSFDCYIYDFDSQFVVDLKARARCRKGVLERGLAFLEISIEDVPFDENTWRKLNDGKFVKANVLTNLISHVKKKHVLAGADALAKGPRVWSQPIVEVIRSVQKKRTHMRRSEFLEGLEIAKEEYRRKQLADLKVTFGNALRAAFQLNRDTPAWTMHLLEVLNEVD